MTKLTRRNLMTAAAATGLAGALGSRLAFAADEPLGITLVIPSPVGDVGWGHALAAGLEPIKAAYGDKVKVTVLENIAEGPDADRIMNKTVADGNKFLVAGSFGYQNGALQIARRDPSVTVLHASGFQVAPNFSPFAAKYFQGTYLLGMAAAAPRPASSALSPPLPSPSSLPRSTPLRSAPRPSNPISRSRWSG